jgi:hypothetical protein
MRAGPRGYSIHYGGVDSTKLGKRGSTTGTNLLRFGFVLRASLGIAPDDQRRIHGCGRTEKSTKLFHARMQVLRIEEWCVEAENAEEARALLAAGAGHRCAPGESLHVEFRQFIED